MDARLAHIFRHPLKGHGREALAGTDLSAGHCLPFDRHWAVAHDSARLVPGWNPCVNFSRGAKVAALQAIDAQLIEGAQMSLELTHPDLPALRFTPDNPEDVTRFLDWVAPLMPEGRAQPRAIVSAGRGMTDTDFESVSVLSLASNRALGGRMGMDLDIGRWRANLWLDGLDPWAEFDLIGREITIGTARLRLMARVTRCRATMANPATGQIDADTLGALEAEFGHRDFGVYATVTHSGAIAMGDRIEVLA